jgi:hypothetical protein
VARLRPGEARFRVFARHRGGHAPCFYDRQEGAPIMKYGIAWLIGIPPVLIVAWFLFNHC